MRNTRHTTRLRRMATCGIALAAVLLTVGCSPVNYSINHVMVPLMDKSREAAFLSDDVQTFRDATPSNLFLLEGMIHNSPGNHELRMTASMLYFSYAFAFQEEPDPDYASLLYRKGRDHALAALAMNDDFTAAADGPFSDFEANLAVLGSADAEAAAWAAVNWSQYIALHLDQTRVMRDIPKAQALMETSAALDPDYFAGLCHITIGALHAFKPPMMGGDPEASRASFERAFDVGGNSFLLSRVFYAKFYAYRVMDDVLFEETLEQVIAAELPDDDPYRLLNLIARDRARSLLEEIDELF